VSTCANPSPLPPRPALPSLSGTVARESAAEAFGEAHAETPALVSSIDAVASARLKKVGLQALLVEVAALLSEPQISMVVVCDAGGSALGVITETVLVRRLGLWQADFFTNHAGEVMTREIIYCRPDERLAGVLAMMHCPGLIHVLVVGADGQPLGAVNARDGLRPLLATRQRRYCATM